MRNIICDIDGTIADISHRLHFIEKAPKDWDAFHAACKNDTVIENIKALLDLINTSDDVYFFYITGRPEKSRKDTEQWLEKHNFPIGTLYMREDGDRREDFVIKKEALKAMGYYECERIWLVLEDRTQVVKMWREMGLTCLQVKDGDY